jgi:two-component system, LytTR family, sensor kinase
MKLRLLSTKSSRVSWPVKLILVFILFFFFNVGFRILADNFKVDYFVLVVTNLLYYTFTLIVYYWCFGGPRNIVINYKTYIRSGVFLIFVAVTLYFYFNWFMPYMGRIEYRDSSLFAFFWNTMETFTVYYTYGFIYWQYKRSVKTEREKRRIENEKLMREQEYLRLQYYFLRAQINPHFLFNTLNFFYSRAQEYDEDLADGISKLGHIMRYALRGDGGSGLINVEDEIVHLDNYIKIHQLRSNFSLPIKVSKNIETLHFALPGLVLITLVENAFKYGIFDTPEKPLLISVSCSKEKFNFCIINHINHTLDKKLVGNDGIGLANIKARTLQHFGGRCVFDTRTEGETFVAEISIDVVAGDFIRVNDNINEAL